jgi:hypothetical protein
MLSSCRTTLTPGSGVLFEKLTLPQLIKIFPEFFETQRFIKI